MKRLGILGSTGSIGSQTLEIVKAYREDFDIVGLLAKRSSDKLLLQAKEFKPKYISCYEDPKREWLESLPKGVNFLKGEEGLKAIIEESDILMNAISGIDGILPTYLVLQKDKRLLAANKESLICLGKMLREKRSLIVPVDSEHNALFQLLLALDRRDIKKLYLTASGGPFREKSPEELKRVKVEDALKHPTWKMGAKITIDSATLMNKGMELLEAINLFDIPIEALDVLIHPQSVVHGIVELIDGSYLFHVSQTDMRIPILYSLYYPQRKPFPFYRKTLVELAPVHFERVDTEKFKSIPICKWVALMGDPYPTVLVGADQAAVELFLEGKIGFLEIADIVEEVLSSVNFGEGESIEDILRILEWSYQKGREVAKIKG